MYKRNCVLSFLAIVSVTCSTSVTALPPEETEISPNAIKHNLINTPLLTHTEAQIQLSPADQLKLKMDQGLAEFRQTLLLQQESITLLKQRLSKQSKVITEQKNELEKQNKEIKFLQSQMLSHDKLNKARATGVKDTANSTGHANKPLQDKQYKIAQNTTTPNPGKAEIATKRKKKTRPEERPEITAIPEIGGVLTAKGLLMLEPGIQASHSSFSQFTFLGAEIIDSFFVGLFQAEDTSRDLISPQLTARFGITNRLEAEIKVPYTYRKDDVTGTIPQLSNESGQPVTVNRNFSGHGLGDIEMAFHYQLNDGSDGWPFFIGNIRGKSVTGEGPFDVERTIFGREKESPTGTGFYSLEPSVTILYPTDPAVLFANIGYLINFEKDINKTFVQSADTSGRVETNQFGNVDPGDSFRMSLGMGYSINERTSLTLGYKHDFIDGTEFEVNGTKISSNDLSVGSLLLGWGFSFTPKVSANLNLELGITQDAPDVLVTLRIPFKAYQFEI